VRGLIGFNVPIDAVLLLIQQTTPFILYDISNYIFVMGLGRLSGIVLLLVASAHTYRTRQTGNQTLPIIDLGYELHQASNFNVLRSDLALPEGYS
jgi:hypothetical protein